MQIWLKEALSINPSESDVLDQKSPLLTKYSLVKTLWSLESFSLWLSWKLDWATDNENLIIKMMLSS